MLSIYTLYINLFLPLILFMECFMKVIIDCTLSFFYKRTFLFPSVYISVLFILYFHLCFAYVLNYFRKCNPDFTLWSSNITTDYIYHWCMVCGFFTFIKLHIKHMYLCMLVFFMLVFFYIFWKTFCICNLLSRTFIKIFNRMINEFRL